MTTENRMRVDPMVALQEALVREEFLKDRTLFLSQSLASLQAEQKALTERVTALEADLRLARQEAEVEVSE